MFIWTLTDLICLIIAGLCFFLMAAIKLYEMWIQWRCKHDGGVGETMACDAICRQWGKNLGFIGTWRDRQKGKKR
jgi:hypothetical protein